MVRYFYSWTPLVLAGTVVLLTLPWLGLIALVVFALVALAALASAAVVVPYALGRAAGRLWHLRTAATPNPAAVLSPAAPRPASAVIAASIAHLPAGPDVTSKPPEARPTP